MDGEDAARLFRSAWIEGVRRHYPGDPKPGYVVAWEDMSDWERDSVRAVTALLQQLVRASDGATASLGREQRGQFVAICWNAQVHHHLPSPKPSYVAPWTELPAWQRETDADIFDAIEQATLEPASRRG